MASFIRSIKNKGSIAILLSIYTITASMALNHGDTTLGNSPSTHLLFVLIKSLALYCAVFFFIIAKNKEVDSKFLYYFIPYAIYLIVSSTFSLDELLAFGLFAIISSENKKVCFELYRTYLVLSSILGIIAYIAFVVGLPLPYSIIPLYGDIAGSYINYRFAYLDLSLEGLRLCGFFNEPGYFGTIVALALIADKFDLNKKGNIIILIAGVLSMSMAFFVLIGLYVISVNIFNPQRLFTILLLIIIFVFLFIQLDIIPVELMEHLIGRFGFEDGRFTGDNRSSAEIDETLEYMLNSSYKYFGYGKNIPIEQGMSLTYKYHIIQFGIVGAFLTWGSLLLVALKTSKWSYQSLVFIGLFFMSIYQRPGIYTLCYFVILFGGLLHQQVTSEK